MDRSIAQSLTGLIPTLTGPLPPSLIELANSLLAQSRSRASSLKAEEEIARSYACANIACERLKRALNLPKIQPRPPCPPKTYQSLYRYLDRALPAHTRRSARSPKRRASSPLPPTTSSPARTPTSTATATATATKARTTLSKLRTPSKALARTGTPYKAVGSVTGTPTPTPGKRAHGLRHTEPGADVPAWTMGAIRRLCAALDAPAAPPHVFAGVSSILTLPLPVLELGGSGAGTGPGTGTTGEGPRKRDKVPALIVAVFLFVATRLVGRETSGGEYSARKETGMRALGGDREGEGEGIEGRDVDGWVREIGARGWQTLDWFANVREGGGLGVGEDVGGEEDGSGNDGVAGDEERGDMAEPVRSVKRRGKGMGVRGVGVGTLQAGLGTMMQDKVDYLSEERRLDYLEWKADMMARIESVQRQRNMVTAAG